MHVEEDAMDSKQMRIKVGTVSGQALSMKKTTNPTALKDISTKKGLGTAEGTTENTADV
jgi:hypothetical protein